MWWSAKYLDFNSCWCSCPQSHSVGWRLPFHLCLVKLCYSEFMWKAARPVKNLFVYNMPVNVLLFLCVFLALYLLFRCFLVSSLFLCLCFLFFVSCFFVCLLVCLFLSLFLCVFAYTSPTAWRQRTQLSANANETSLWELLCTSSTCRIQEKSGADMMGHWHDTEYQA